ncbi:hypothetical protein [Streptomyces pratensis]|uniref:hypothetical protein n=1 Tax=Streptomyces pratensis TaxID=1169025 RepID=UPI0019326099|nr:hypothetical protein [Streptomyces pratensis]
MAMTLKVYEVNRDGGIRVVREEAEVVPVAASEPSSAYPACKCRRCGSGSS